MDKDACVQTVVFKVSNWNE